MAKPKRKVSKGTGQKYQPETTQQPGKARPSRPGYPEASLRRKLEKFTTSDLASQEVFQALSLYFEQEISPTNIEKIPFVDELFTCFLEWFTYDYTLSIGKRLVDVFQAEAGSTLSNTQKDILAHWIANKRLHLLEVQEIEPGVKLIAKDLLNGERLELHDVLASQHTSQWEILLARPEWSADRISFAPEIYLLRPRNRGEILEKAQKLWADYQQQHPQNSLLNFYRDHSLDLILATRRIQDEEDTPPTPVTEEGHELCFCSAFFDVLSTKEAIADLLNAAEEFEFEGYEDDDPDILNFNWLKRGRSNVPPAEQKPKKAMLIKSARVTPEGLESEISLGTVTLWEKEIGLETVSFERMEAGKLLLTEILGEHIRYQEGEDEIITWKEKMEFDDEDAWEEDDDDFDDLDFEDDFDESDEDIEDEILVDGWESDDSVVEDVDDDEELTDEEVAQIQKQWLEKHQQDWLDEPLPALHDLTPRQAAQNPQERPNLIMVLKDIEFSIAINPNLPGGGMDVAFLRQELGITNEDMLA
jgi:hypothetical protein